MRSIPVRCLSVLFLSSAVSAFLPLRVAVVPHTSLFEQIRGDTLRESTGIRPSLHPTTINALAEFLKQRAAADSDAKRMEPLEVALLAGKIATNAIAKRQESSKKDGMTFEAKEEQTIAGRVVGVAVRLDSLGEELYRKTSGVDWVKKYNEWASFGVLETESGLEERIKSDPLFAMSRAECLLAIFLQTVETPQLEKIGETVPGGSNVDFIDEDRKGVLLPSN